MTGFFINRPIFATAVAIIMLLAGAISILALPIAQFPNIAPGTVNVTAGYTGASAAVTERLLTEPLETQINGVEGMIYMSSSSTANGSSIITVTFDIGYDLNIGAVDIQNRVQTAQAQLPEVTQRAGISIVKASQDLTMLINLISPNGTFDGVYLGNYAQINIIDPLTRVPGVGEVDNFGVLNYSIRVWLDPEKMAGLGITTNDVINAVNYQNTDVAAGVIGQPPMPGTPATQYQLNTLGQLRTTEQFNDIVVRANDDGSVVYVKDIGRVELGAQSYTATSRCNGEGAATLGIFQLPGSNALDVANGIIAELELLSKTFPADLEYQVTFNLTDFVKVSMQELVYTLLEAIGLVIIVVFVFLQNWRTTLIPIIAIPVSLICTFAIMAAVGFSINTLSLLGLVLAVGLVVDDAIVVVENVERQLESGIKDIRAATRQAMKEVTGPIVATTLVLMAVFVPTAFMPGITGLLYNQFALTIAFAVGLSAFNSLSLSPALCGVMLRPRKEKERKIAPARWFNKSFDWTSDKYHRLVEKSAKLWWIVAIIFVALLIWTWFAISTRPTGFVPAEDQGWFFAVAELPPGSALSRTQAVESEAVAIILKNPNVADVVSVSGLNFISNTASSNFSVFFIILKSWDERKTEESQIPGIIKVVSESLAPIEEAMVIPFNAPAIPGLGTTGGAQIQIEALGGQSPEEVSKITNQYIEEGLKNPVIGALFTDFKVDYPQIELNIDRVQAQILSVSINDLFTALNVYLASYYVNNYNQYGQVYQVNVMADGIAREEPEDILKLYVENSQGEAIPFSELMTLDFTTGPANIPHYNMYRTAEVIGGPAPGHSGGALITAMEEVANEVLIPNGYGWEWTSMVYQAKEAGSWAPIIFGLGIICVFLVLACLYESWSMPFMIILAVPLAILGAALGLQIAGLSLDIYGQIGLLMLIGLAAKNAILIVEFAKGQREQGAGVIEAAATAAKMRLRPILMTAFAFILGVVPLVLASGAGANSRHSIGTVVLGGMVASTILSLLVVPVLYVVIELLREKMGIRPTVLMEREARAQSEQIEANKLAVESLQKQIDLNKPDASSGGHKPS